MLFNGNNFPVTLSYKQLIIWSITAVLLLAFWYLVAKTRLGRAQRACEQDQKMAALVGVDVDRTISMTFVIAAALAAVAGTMYLMYYGVVTFSDGFVPGVKAFTAAVLGGIGSLPGAVVGGMLIGLIETFWSAYFSIDYKDVAAFSVLAITLIFLPQGLFGRPDVEEVWNASRWRARRARRVGALRDAGFTGLVALGLLLPLIGSDVSMAASSSILTTRWPLLFALVAIIAAGRFLYCFALAPWLARARAQAGRKAAHASAPARRYLAKWLVPFAFGFFHRLSGYRLSHGRLQRCPEMDRQFRHPDSDLCDARLGPQYRGRARRPARPRLCRVLCGRRLFLCAAGENFRADVLDLLPLAGMLASFWGVLLGFPVLRLRGDYLAIVTLAFGEIIRMVLINWVR